VSLRVEWRTGRSGLVDVSDRWDALAARTASPFTRSDWLLAWTGAFAADRDLVLCTVWDGPELVAGLPLLRQGRRRWSAPVNDHTPRFAPVYRDVSSLDAVVAAVVATAPAALHVGGLAVDDPALASVRAAADRRGLLVRIEDGLVSPVVDLSAGAEAYRAERGKRLREYERRRRKAVREHRAEFVLVERPPDLARHLDAGLRLEASGWKGRSRTAILSAVPTERFYRDLVSRLDADDRLRLSSLWLDGRMAAFDLAVLEGGRYHLLKTAYDEEHRGLAPGMVLRLAVLDRCFELGLTAHEFLGPDMPWKRVFTDSARRHCAVRVYDRSAVGVSGFAYRRWVRPQLRTARTTLLSARARVSRG